MGRLIAKTEKVWLWLFLLFIPTQLGKHFWLEWSQVIGVRVDYLSVIVYFVDLLWLGLVISKLRITNYELRINNYELRIKNWLTFQNIIVIIFVLLNILVAGNKGVAVYRWLRMFQWWWFYKYCLKNKKLVWSYLKTIIPCWIIVESLLGLSQIVKGESLGGWWYWLGERRFDFTTIGIAQMSVFGQGLVRAYGTFSHPNSMAGFLLVSIGLWMKHYGNLKFKISNFKLRRVWWWAIVWCGIVGIILSGSRTVWGLAIMLPVIFNKKKFIGFGIITIGMFLLVLGMVGVNYRIIDFVGGWDSDSLAKRANLNMVAMRMWRDNLMVGVGNGNFIPKLPEYQQDSKFYWLQPVHNIFLLLGSEIGMLGIIIIIKLLITNYELRITKKNKLILGIVLITGMMDHYWITLPQNSWLLAIVLGVF